MSKWLKEVKLRKREFAGRPRRKTKESEVLKWSSIIDQEIHQFEDLRAKCKGESSIGTLRAAGCPTLTVMNPRKNVKFVESTMTRLTNEALVFRTIVLTLLSSFDGHV
ncbi:uncharacterized protein LOC114319852 [Camellia sinensis]|uniref:uncharacterized protein LOC114319852 n=1 Tax=Camellia sinensis TaxID=4442 RepID=UPI0010369C84|nr:uncharacterized protein LOC114319852 [Camellia sinensis]